jgi:hypothetical protein
VPELHRLVPLLVIHRVLRPCSMQLSAVIEKAVENQATACLYQLQLPAVVLSSVSLTSAACCIAV